jgi:hypothetical protein
MTSTIIGSARRQAERDALRPVLHSIKEAGHDPQPPHRSDAYGNDFLIVCRSCGARVEATLWIHDGGSRIAEVTYDSATATTCTTSHDRHDCDENAVPYISDGPLGHGWECGICGTFLQAG